MLTEPHAGRFTLRDLMVAIAVIGLGLAAISVLIAQSHSSGKRAQCLNNLRSHTILVADHSNGGASLAHSSISSPYFWAIAGQALPTHWATAHPNFVGFITSGRICAPSGDCSRGEDLEAVGGAQDGPGWLRANQRGSSEELNAALRYGFSVQGSSPFANSEHPGGVCVGMCDGSARFITEEINGVVWAKLITPDGESLPPLFRQLPLAADDLP